MATEQHQLIDQVEYDKYEYEETEKCKNYWFLKLLLFYLGVSLILSSAIVNLVNFYLAYQSFHDKKHFDIEVTLDRLMFIGLVAVIPILLGQLIQKLVHHLDTTTES